MWRAGLDARGMAMVVCTLLQLTGHTLAEDVLFMQPPVEVTTNISCGATSELGLVQSVSAHSALYDMHKPLGVKPQGLDAVPIYTLVPEIGCEVPEKTCIRYGPEETDNACGLNNFITTSGRDWIAVVKRSKSQCTFASKVKLAQDLGASAVLVWNEGGANYVPMGGGSVLF